MEYFQIQAFRPVESKVDNPDQDRTVLRLAEGVLVVPTGALCNGPTWKSLWGITDLPARIATALAGANSAKAHFVKVTRGNHVFLVVWSLVSSKPLGAFYVTAGAPADYDLDSTGGVTVTSTNNSTWRDKDPEAPWFASIIADRLFLGNGVDLNLQWKSAALSILGPAAAPGDIYDNSKVRIPPCTSFAMSGTKSIFSAGNAAQPLRVWITHPPSASYPFNEGIYSLDQSFIDLAFCGATKITALSAFQDYITAHTDGKPVNMFGVDQTSDGWKCVQTPGVANASAPCPAAVGDAYGLASFYFGSDGEVYKDEAIRAGPYSKQVAREQEIATAMGSGEWNRDMTKPVAAGRCSVVYDRRTSLLWLFAELSLVSTRMGLWCYNERNRSVSGPIRYPNALVSTVVRTPAEKCLAAVITASGEMLYSDLSSVGETQEFLQESMSAPLGAAYGELTVAPTPTPGMPYVAATADCSTFAEVLGASQLTAASVWDPMTVGGSYAFTRFWKDAYLARIETGYLDFGQPSLLKNYHQLQLTFQKHTRAYVAVCLETEGRSAVKWKGLVFARESWSLPFTLAGRRVRVRLVVVFFNGARGLLRDITIGWTPGGMS